MLTLNLTSVPCQNNLREKRVVRHLTGDRMPTFGVVSLGISDADLASQTLAQISVFKLETCIQ